ncbi:palmitoyl-(protein) hydrolase [Pneumocystis jirovecii RU7]|uniref:Acyl-protein thioesterase 1 n=1 Tax=Pneumocystis jirovecii (strain RU7) TaxID=1408657 RepID=A0A0W4ZUM4_PNEJ7|nr:palmitoyl-(protein) hydrolase [Pneumocystis jirovecii RU7]KTW32078.1 hypothetical protein T551_00760 [Pneumocystis jirovecii RU7]
MISYEICVGTSNKREKEKKRLSRASVFLKGRMSFSAITVPARARHSATVIFAHGLGDSGAGWAFLGEQMSALPCFHHIKWIFPNALPSRPVTINMGMMMPSWYDIRSLDGVNEDEDEEQMLKSVHQLHRLITEEVEYGIQSERIVVGGFSQGMTGLTYERKLGGIIALSGYLPLRNKICAMTSESNSKIPIFMAHGKSDPIVKFEYGKASASILRDQIKHNVDWKEYDGLQHSTNQHELKDLSIWLEKILG